MLCTTRHSSDRRTREGRPLLTRGYTLTSILGDEFHSSTLTLCLTARSCKGNGNLTHKISSSEYPLLSSNFWANEEKSDRNNRRSEQQRPRPSPPSGHLFVFHRVLAYIHHSPKLSESPRSFLSRLIDIESNPPPPHLKQEENPS